MESETQQLTIKKEPHNLELEQDVLGSVFMDNKNMNELIDNIKHTTFYNDMHKKIFTAMSYLHYENMNIGYQEVIDRLEIKKAKIDVDYILSLTDTVASTVNLEHKVQQLLDLEHKRNLYEASRYVLTENISGISSKNIVDKMQKALESSTVVNNMEIVSTHEYADEWLEDFNKPLGYNKLLFGMKKLDDIIGIETTGMTTLAGATGSGKSALLLNMTKNFCLQNRHVLFLTLEMSKRQVLNRLIANISRVSHDKIKNKKVKEKWEKDAIEEAVRKIAKMNLYIYDRGSMNVEHLYNLAKKLKKQGKLDIVAVDYLQLLDTGKNNDGNNSQRIGYISRKLKMLAQDLYVPVIALSQLNRNIIDGKTGKRREPVLADLKESSSIEQDSNHVIMLHNKQDETKAKSDVEDETRVFIDILVRKNREGTTGKIPTSFYGHLLEFEEQQWNTDEGKYEPVQQIDLERKNNEDLISDDDLPF